MAKKSKKKTKLKKKKAEGRKKSFFTGLLLFLLFFVLTFALALGGIVLSAYSERIANALNDDLYILQLGITDVSGTEWSYVSADELFINGDLYVCMTDIAQMCEFTVVGNNEELTYFPADNPSESVTFRYNSELATVNGESFHLTAPMIVKTDREDGVSVEKVYIPSTFFTTHATGVNVTFSPEKNKYTIERISLGREYDPLDNPVEIYQPIDFLAERSTVLEPIKQGSVFSTALPPANTVNEQ